MDAQQALADLTEISSQIQAAVIFDEKGTVAASTLDDAARADELARDAARLLDEAAAVRIGDGAPLTQLEAATPEGSVFVVSDDKIRIAATTAPEPAVGLVLYDLKSALRHVSTKEKRSKGAPKKTASAAKTAEPKPPATKKKDDAA
jgi:predicted regulator of Ras-like GTPase activity (Roadblock/LC7/MglB family)